MRILAAFLALCLVEVGCGSHPVGSDSKFYSADAHEVEISFKDHFFVPMAALTGEYTHLDHLTDANAEDRKVLERALKLQTLHLYGVFSYHNAPTDFEAYPGAIQEEGRPQVTRITLQREKNRIRIDYRYRDRGIFYVDLLEEEERWDFSFYLPDQPTTIYRDTMPERPRIDPNTKEPIHPCTDLHDNSDLAFWYYWSPNRDGCPDKIFDQIHLVEARFKRLPSTERTYPVYRELHDGPLDIRLIIGQDEKFGSSTDVGFQTFKHTINYYQNLKLAEGSPTFSTELQDTYHRRLRYRTNRFDAVIDIQYVDTEIKQFDDVARSALRNSDVMIFSGHSYEGYYFDLTRLFPDPLNSLPKDKYQVMFFNACTTYSYYGKDYFSAKKTTDDARGTKRLDIVSNGIGAPFDLETIAENEQLQLTGDIIMINSLLGLTRNGRPLRQLLSWQQILSRITSLAGYDYTALTNVKGDEDNPKRLAADLPVPKPLSALHTRRIGFR